MRTVAVVARWLFILCLPLLLLSASIGWVANSFSVYKYGFEKYGVSQTTGLTETQLDRVATGLIRYFNSSEGYINLSVVKDGAPFALFNEREVAHLKDVKGLIRLDYWILLGSFIYFLGYGISSIWQKDHRLLARSLVCGGVLTLVLMLALGLGALLDFDRLFLQFHLLSFTNELWLLDPTKDYLIMLFPGGFWYDVTLLLALATTAGAVLLGGAGAGHLLLPRNRTAH